MRWKAVIITIVLLAVFPALMTGLAQHVVHAALQAVSSLVGSPHG